MKKVILLVGLCGCGKTTYGNKVKQEIENCAFIDDIRGVDEIKEVDQYDSVIIADPCLCEEKNRDKCIEYFSKHYPNTVIEFKFWENNLENCWSNVLLRNDGRPISKEWLSELSKKYTAPKFDFNVKKH